MEFNRNDENRSRRRRPSRRTVLRHAGTGLLAGTALSGVAAADRGGNGETAGRPTVEASSPACGELAVDYVAGNPPVVVVADGPETREVQLEPGNRSVTWSVAPGDYEVTGTPGTGGSNGEPAVVVDGSPVTVEPCVSEQSTPLTLSVTPQCQSSGYVTYVASNPASDSVTLDIQVEGAFSYTVPHTVEAGATSETPALSGDGAYTHVFTATRDGGDDTPMRVNGETEWSNTPNCSG